MAYRTKERFLFLAKRDGGKHCFYCNVPLKYKKETEKYKKATFDHVVPTSLGGCTHALENLVLACAPCNEKKGNKQLTQSKSSL